MRVLTALFAALTLGSSALAAQDGVALSLDRARYDLGDRPALQVRTADRGYLLVLHADPTGRVRVLFPIQPTDDAYVRGGRRYQILGADGGAPFRVQDGPSRGTVMAVLSGAPLATRDFERRGRWNLAQYDRLGRRDDPERTLLDLAQQLATDDFAYDVVEYELRDRWSNAAPGAPPDADGDEIPDGYAFDPADDYAPDGNVGFRAWDPTAPTWCDPLYYGTAVCTGAWAYGTGWTFVPQRPWWGDPWAGWGYGWPGYGFGWNEVWWGGAPGWGWGPNTPVILQPVPPAPSGPVSRFAGRSWRGMRSAPALVNSLVPPPRSSTGQVRRAGPAVVGNTPPDAVAPVGGGRAPAPGAPSDASRSRGRRWNGAGTSPEPRRAPSPSAAPSSPQPSYSPPPMAAPPPPPPPPAAPAPGSSRGSGRTWNP